MYPYRKYSLVTPDTCINYSKKVGHISCNYPRKDSIIILERIATMIAEGTKPGLAADQIERLRIILEQKQKRTVTLNEAAEVGESLIDFYELLADKTAKVEL